MAERVIKLKETKGRFKCVGKVTGTEKGDRFFSEGTSKSGNKYCSLNFGVETSNDSTTYLSLFGGVKKEVYFYKRAEKKGEKGTTKKVNWSERGVFKEEGYKLIGDVNVGVTKKIDDKGNEVNDNVQMVGYDAAKVMGRELKDGMNVFVRGDLRYSSFKNKDGNVSRKVEFVPAQVSLSKEVDFDTEGFEEVNEFDQTIVFTGIEKDESDKDDVKFIISAKIVNYSSIEDAEFVVRNSKLARTFKRALKPYTAIKVWGHVNNKVITEEVDDEWGDSNPMDNISKTFIRELVITGADKTSIDTETYSEEEMEKAILSLKEFGESKNNNSSSDDDWGSDATIEDSDEDDEW